ncbi:PPC domain-containing protein, partial [bacterium]|nr:PPC domain-containing protein [candidate division CSSED10-310 bacterium]
AGTHYVMVDTWPAPSCIPDFNLTIAECSPSTGACCVAGSCVATNNGMECLALGGSWFEGSTCPDFTCPDPRGNDCLDPIPVTAPAALPYTDAHQTTCGRDNDYTETCLGTFDTGEDIMYELTVTGEVCVDIGVSTTGPFYSGSVGIALGSACPPGAPCIAYDTAGTGEFGTALTSQILAAGVYYIMVDTDGSPACVETFTLTIGECPISPPANDLCEDAWQIVSPYPSIVSGTTKGATVDCAGVLDWTAVWYKFNLGTAKNLLTIDYCETGEDISTIGAIVYPEPIDPPSACPSDCNTYILRTAINWVECPNGCTNPVLTFLLDGPATYYLPVYARQGSGLGVDFSFTVSVEDVSVPNDDCDNATAIDEVTDLAFDTTYATFDGGGICMTGPNLWYCFTSPCDGLVQVSLLGSGYDTKLAVYDGCGCDPPGTELDCNDDFSGLQSLISFEAVQGQSYLIEVGGYSTHVGQGILNVSCPAPIPALSPIGIFALLCGLGLTLRRALRRRG